MINLKVKNEFKNNLQFKELCINLLSRHYPWRNEQVLNYQKVLKFDDRTFMSNKKVVWTETLLEELKDRINWESLWKANGLELNIPFFEKYGDRLNFSSIYLHQNIDWSNQLLDIYADKWHFERMSFRSILAAPRNIKKYGDLYDWISFSGNMHLNLTDQLIEEYEDKWNWGKLCANPSFKPKTHILKKYSDNINWSSLSRNPSMVPFMLAYPDKYPWNWNSFVQNPEVYFSKRMLNFLILKIKKDFDHFKVSEELKTSWAKAKLIKLNVYSLKFNREIFEDSGYVDYFPWKDLIKNKVEVLSEEELIQHWSFEDFERIIPYKAMMMVPASYIEDNQTEFLQFPFSLFRYGKLTQEFVLENAADDDDWYQLGFNQQMEWSIEFLMNNLHHYENTYSLIQNSKIYQILFAEANTSEINNLLNSY